VATGADGRFVARATPGSYAIRGTSGPLTVSPGQGVSIDAASSSAAVRIEMTTGRAISGRVVDSDGRPVSAAEIECVRANAPPFDERQTWAAADGHFRVEGLAPSRYDLVVHAPGWHETRTQADVGEGNIDGIDVALTRGVTLVGQVVGPNGGPAENVSVVVWNFASGKNFPPQRVTSGRDGRFVVDSLSAGFVRVAADSGELGVGFVDRTPLSEASPASVLVTIGPGAAVSGRVVNVAGDPVAGVSVRAFQGHEAMPLLRTVRTTLDGRFSVGRLIPGPLYLVASRGQFSSAPWREKGNAAVARTVISGPAGPNVELRLGD
jgi:hypothetical protein